MTVRLAGEVIALEGDCPAGDAEAVLRLLLDHPDAAVDWSACAGAHTAVVQVLLVARVRPVGSPRSPFLRDMIAPALAPGSGRR